MKDDDFNTARGITTAVLVSLVFWAALLLGAKIWLS
jgi:hypothetical protein